LGSRILSFLGAGVYALEFGGDLAVLEVAHIIQLVIRIPLDFSLLSGSP
jgi:hypothetical protein